jgi:hypothetical protein
MNISHFLEPPNNGHLWTTTTFLRPQGWSLCTGLTVFEITQIQCKKNVFLDLSFFALEKDTNQIRIVSRLICEFT